MDRGLNKEILRLSIPSILANITVPLVGIVDTAVAGHLPAADGCSAAGYIGAISVGGMLFSLLYWSFGFLRTGTGGLTAQAYGRGDFRECGRIFVRSVGLALAVAAAVLLLQWPYLKLVLFCTQGTAEVENLATRYFFIRIWAAPATLSLMAFRGWFVGMQDSIRSMWADLVVNAVNIAASIVLSLGIGGWSGLGFDGVALGTVIAQYSGLLYCVLATCVRYGRKVFARLDSEAVRSIAGKGALRGYMRMNLDYFGRSVFFMVIYIGYTAIAAKYGDMALAASSIMMQILMLFSYFTDGFAYAGEALTGRFIGAKDLRMTRMSVRYVFVWSMAIAVVFVGLYQALGEPIVRIMTDDAAVAGYCKQFLPWLILMPPLGCAAFFWDGVYLGATASRPMCTSMMWAAAAFLGVWFICKAMILPGPDGAAAIHCLLGAYFCHLLVRTVLLTIRYKSAVLSMF